LHPIVLGVALGTSLPQKSRKTCLMCDETTPIHSDFFFNKIYLEIDEVAFAVL